jgi:hypothetical protein
VGAIDRLRFNCRIPPRIEQEDVRSGGEIEARAARFQADEKELAARIGLEAFDARLAVSCLAVEIFIVLSSRKN